MVAAEQIDGRSEPRSHFVMIPNMADDELDPFEFRLLGHYMRVCGQNGGQCWQSVKAIHAITRISLGMITKTRNRLQEKGYITVDIPDAKARGKGIACIVAIIDRWKENTERYQATCSPDELTISPGESTCSLHESTCSPGEPKKIYIQEPEKEDRQTDYEPVANLNRGADEIGVGLSADDKKLKSNFEGVFGGTTPLIWDELKGLAVYYSHVFVSVAISNGEKLRQKGDSIRDPMAYIRTALANMASKGIIPHLTATAPRSSVPYSPTSAVPSVQPAPVNIHPKQRSAPVTQERVLVDLEGFKRKIAERHERERSQDYVPRSTV